MTAVPRGSVLALSLFSIFVSDTDSGIKGTLSRSATDTKLCGAVNLLQRRDGIQRGLEGLERWGCAHPMKVKKTKCKVLYLDQGNPKHRGRLGSRWNESGPGEKQ